MTRLVLISACLSGCFYTDSINQRPSLDIHQVDPGAAVYHNNTLAFAAIKNDPDGDSVAVTWRAYACTGTICDQAEFTSGADTTFTVTTPATRTNGEVFDTLHVVLEGRDVHGATARPSQTLDLNVIDAPPTLVLSKDARNSYVVGTDIGIYARVGDLDDGFANVTLGPWIAMAPASAANITLSETLAVAPDADPRFEQLGMKFTPMAIGDWNIEVTATDPGGLAATEELPVSVVADHPPCLAQWEPTATPVAGTTVPMTDPTLFQILVVSDDLDPFPSPPSDPFGTTEFHWSIVPPNGTRQLLTGVTGSGVALDPDSYTPGDIVELRVEIQDRKHTAVNCPATDLTCSVISDQSCLQRLSWRVEVR
ncbi:hypothetical protein BH11MYX1_BH11MYX1_17580 [soil metagenome]